MKIICIRNRRNRSPVTLWGMESSNSRRPTNRKQKLPVSDRTQTLRLSLSSVEADDLDDRLMIAQRENRRTTKAIIVRDAVLTVPTEAIPDFAAATGDVPEREIELRVRVSPAEVKRLHALANAAKTDVGTYARWRLFGVVR